MSGSDALKRTAVVTFFFITAQSRPAALRHYQRASGSASKSLREKKVKQRKALNS